MVTGDAVWTGILNALAEGVIVCGVDGRIETCNAAAERILGLTLGQMRGVEPTDCRWRVISEDDATLATTAEGLLRTVPGKTGVIIRIDKPDGSVAWLYLKSELVSADGVPEAVVTTVTDITDRRRADDALRAEKQRWQHESDERSRVEQELRQRNRYFETVLEEAPIGFAVHTIDDGIGRFVSARYDQIYGVPRGTIDCHQTFFEKIWPYDPVLREEIQRRVVADMTSGDPSRMHWEDVPVPSATGELRYIDAMNIPFLDQNLMVSVVQDVTHRVESEKALKASEALYRLLAENVSDLIWILDVEALRFRYVSPSVQQFLGYTAEELLAQGWIPAIFESDSAQSAVRTLIERMQAFREGGPESYTDHLELTRRDGSAIWVEFTARYVMNDDTGRVEAYGVSRDITERRLAEAERQRLSAELLQAQKLESIGRLAGGVAHDFNNILADIAVQVGLATARHPHMKEVFDELRRDVDLAATLTRQLLLFSRRSAIDTRLLDLNDIAANLFNMLGRLLGQSISLQFEPSREQAAVYADAGMLEQVVINLAVNARDAMQFGGILTLRLTAVDVGEEEVTGKPGSRPGSFVCLSVSDTGHGMSEETLAHVFEPFFTTKGPGKGTGLGLSMVQGIVDQHKGWIEVESIVGKGSTFSVFLPAAGRLVQDVEDRTVHTVPAGTETILLVDDFAELREKIAEFLRSLGYEVMEAGSAEEALQKWQNHRARIRLLFTDVSLPGGLSGLRLADTLCESDSTLKVILSSGYGDELIEEARIAAGMVYLPKPCEVGAMARTIRKCFEQR